MFPLLGGLISGGASLLSSMFSSDQSAKNVQAQIAGQEAMQQESERFNADQAEANRNFQAQQSSTAYQRASQDMQKAGLNPAMMFGSGGGASTPSGSTASVGTPTMPKVDTQSAGAGIAEAVSKAVNTAISVKTMDKMTEEIANLKATENLTVASTGLRKQETRTEEQETLNRDQTNALRALLFPGARFSAKQAEDLNSLPDWARAAAVKAGWLGQKGSDTISPFVSGAGALRRWMPETVERSRQHAGDGSFDEFYQSRVGR